MEAKFETAVNLANIEGKNKSRLVFEKLQQGVEAQKAALAQENFRANDMSKAIVNAEIVQAMADADYHEQTKKSDAYLYNEIKLAESDKEVFAAQANGIKLLQKAFKGDNKATLNYLMIEDGLHLDLAKINGSAIEGLKPKITVWNNGKNEGIFSST
jgi:flotillin